MRRPRHLPLRATSLLPVLAFCWAAQAPQAIAEEVCPTTDYLYDYPHHRSPGDFSNELQGLAHDADHWFFAQRERLWKFPVDFDLNDEPDRDDPATPLVDEGHDDETSYDLLDPGVISRSLTETGTPTGYNHFGDFDQYGGYLFIAVEDQTDPRRAAIGAYRTSDLTLVSLVEVTALQGASIGWTAVDPASGILYAAGSGNRVFKYHIEIDTLRTSGDLGLALAFLGEFPLLAADGSPLGFELNSLQGGAVTPWGDIYISNGFLEPDVHGGIHLFDSSGRLIDESQNGSGAFNFEWHPEGTTDEEPEGLDWWNRDLGTASPGPSGTRMGGQLHAILLDNDVEIPVFEDDDDEYYLKHYEVGYACKGSADSDGDGLTDLDEVYVYDTIRDNADTDGDGLNDGDEIAAGTDPHATDSDGDGLSDGDEVNRYGSDPTLRDTDGDGLEDGQEVAAGTNPTLRDTDGDGLTDGQEILVYGTNPLLPDTDGDGAADGAEVAAGTNPLDSDSDDDLLPDGIELNNGTNPLVADSDGDGLIDGRDVEFIQNGVQKLLASSLKSPQAATRHAMLRILDEIEQLLLSGNRADAGRKLRNLRLRMDGCGSGADSNDWILECSSQMRIRGLVDLLLRNLTA